MAEVKRKTTVTRTDIVEGLRRLGVKEGDLLQVHSSLSSFGYVVGGADAVVDALLEVVGREGTVMVPTFNHGRAEIFDPRETPSVNGIITEALRKRPEAKRSIHPTHPYAAIGKHAEYLTAEHLELRTFDINSPLGKLAKLGGYVLFLGAPFSTNTAAHIGETMANVPCLGYRKFPRKVRLPDGRIISAWSVLWREDKCPIEWEPLESEMRSRNMIRDGKIGEAHIMLMKAMDVIQTTFELTKKFCPNCNIKPRRLEK